MRAKYDLLIVESWKSLVGCPESLVMRGIIAIIGLIVSCPRSSRHSKSGDSQGTTYCILGSCSTTRYVQLNLLIVPRKKGAILMLSDGKRLLFSVLYIGMAQRDCGSIDFFIVLVGIHIKRT